MPKVPKFFPIAILAGLYGAGFGQALKFTDAFPGTKFAEPVYFGAVPGRAQTYVVLEQHKGNAILVSRKGNAWVKDTLARLAVNQADEMGLLGLAFHPDFAKNRRYYLSYNPPGSPLYDIVEERVADSAGMKDSGAKPRILFQIADKWDNHNGGTIAFGPKDGFLYFGIGDGGYGGDPDNNAQNTNVLLGKILRIDVDRKDAGLEYGIPADNPYAKGGGRPEIFALGLRNPWKWSFDPLNGDLWAGDVGQDQVEEVDIVTLGGNYGWKVMEGPSGTNDGKLILPVFSYRHTVGSCIIGGVVFRGNPASKYYGAYFTADINTRKLWALRKNGTGLATVEELPATITGISSFGTDAEGRVYAVGLVTGIIYYLDHPDLAPAVSHLSGSAPAPGRAGRAFTASPGGRLDPRAFYGAAALEMFTTGGVRLGLLTRNDPRLPAQAGPGVYLLRSPESRAWPDLLVVR